MRTTRSATRAITLVSAITALCLGLLAQSAFAAAPPYNVSVTQFSKAVSGVAPPGATGVTVNLLRNGVDNNGQPVTNKIDSCTSTMGSGQSWSCSFATHPFSMNDDQVQVAYAGTIANDPPSSGTTPAPSPSQITLSSSGARTVPGESTFDTALHPVNFLLSLDEFDSAFWVDYQGKTANCDNTNWCDQVYNNATAGTESQTGFDVSVAGGTAQTTGTQDTNSPNPNVDTLTFSTPVTATQPLEITVHRVIDTYNITGESNTGGTMINVSFPGPQLSIQDPPNTGAPSGTTAESNPIIEGLPSCTAYLVLNEVTCSNLVPGTYTVSNGSASATMTVPAATNVPNQPAYNASSNNPGDAFVEQNVPQRGGVVLSGLAGGQTVTVSAGTRVLDSVLVAPLKFMTARPLGDLDNGAHATVTGTCATGLFFGDTYEIEHNLIHNIGDMCTGGAIPSSNTFTGGLSNMSQRPETGVGDTSVFLPYLYAGLGTTFNYSINTPFTVMALPRYNDPITGSGGVNDNNTPTPASGSKPVLASTMSADPVVFAYAPLNPTTGATGTYVNLGNVNVAGGLQLPPTLPIGWYAGVFTMTDTNGDSEQQTTTFYNQGATGPTIAAAACTAKVKGGGLHKATIARKKKGKKKTSKTVTVSFSCTGTSGDRVALWIQRGSTVIADGSGTLKGGHAKIAMTGTGIKKGTYQLIEVVDQNGHSAETNHTLTLK